jgi:outer membrane murein-binding lipoprotein Lpp
MPPALDTVTSGGTAIGATLAATTILAGDSFTVKNASLSSDVLLLNFWVDAQVAGMVRIHSPKLHDNTDGIRSRTRLNNLEPVLPFGVPQRLVPQDTEIVELAGSAVAGDIETVTQLIYYADLPGQAARFITPDQLKQRAKNHFGNRLAITVGSTLAYTGGRAINADQDLLKANTDYAVLGMSSDLRVGAICLRGPDTGNLRVSQPGGADVQGSMKRADWFFRDISFWYGLPLIPVINSANKGATQIDVVGDENGGTANVTLWLVELG